MFCKHDLDSFFMSGFLALIWIPIHLFAAAFLALFLLSAPFNECRQVRALASVQEARPSVISVSSEKIDPANDGKLIHISGRVSSPQAPLADGYLVATEALVLKRMVRMYQWDEICLEETTTSSVGSETATRSYSYEKTWYPELINSAKFQSPASYANPSLMAPGPLTMNASSITLGAFSLHGKLLAWALQEEPLVIKQPSPSAESLGSPAPQVDQGGLYLGNDPQTPQIGDRRITYSQARAQDITIIARQTGNGFSPFPTRTGGAIEFLGRGKKSADELFAEVTGETVEEVWFGRIFIFLFMTPCIWFILPLSPRFLGILPGIANVILYQSVFRGMFVSSWVSLSILLFAWILSRPLWFSIPLLIVLTWSCLDFGKRPAQKGKGLFSLPTGGAEG